jgi:hypothetical protein
MPGDRETDGTAAANALGIQLTVKGAIAESVLTLMRERFDNVTTAAAAGPSTVVTIIGIDQAGVRALLALLWDTGHEIGSLISPSVST